MRPPRVALLIPAMMAIHVLSGPRVEGSLAGAADVLTIVAPAAPGGGWDQTARVMQQVLAATEPDRPVQVENVPGAAGTIGLARFVSADRGNPNALLVTGLVMVSGIVTNHAPVTLADTTPIARLTGEYEVIVVPASSPWRSLQDLIAAFKASPAAVSWGGGSAGGTDDLLVRLIADAVGVAPNRVNYIAFPGGGAALAALLGGQVTAGVSGYAEFAGQIAAGTLRLLAVSSPSRVEGIDAPTLRDENIPLDLANWRGIVAPPGLTEAEREQLTARIERMTASPQWKAMLARNGWANLTLTGATYRQFLLAEQHRIDEVLRRLDSTNTTGSRSALRLTPATIPSIVIAGLVILLSIALSGHRHRGPAAGATNRSSRPFLLLAVLAVNAVVMPRIGFIPASAALFTAAAWLLGSHRPARDAVIGVVIASALFIAFTRGLGLALPVDPMTSLWR